jgi:hypothetical protein
MVVKFSHLRILALGLKNWIKATKENTVAMVTLIAPTNDMVCYIPAKVKSGSLKTWLFENLGYLSKSS